MERFIARLLIFLSLLAVGRCQDEPEITQIILPEVKPAGETGRLNCTITRHGLNNVNWIHTVDQMTISTNDEIQIDESLNSLIDGYRKYDVVMTANGGLQTYMLIVRRLQPSDAGMYTCQVQITGDTNRNLEAIGLMLVMYPPTMKHAQTSQTITLAVDEDLDLHCEAEAYPLPIIKWVRPNGKALPIAGQPFSFSNDTLPLRKITKEDRGVYRCIADNNVPPAGFYDVTLYVLFPPYARAVQTSYGQAMSRQFDVTLECRIAGNPEPNLQWFEQVDDSTALTPITNDDRHIVHILISHGQDASISEFWFQLTIINVLANDYGNFVCRGHNDLGTHEATVFLYPTSECQGPNCPAESQPSSGAIPSVSALMVFLLTACRQFL